MGLGKLVLEMITFEMYSYCVVIKLAVIKFQSKISAIRVQKV